jgi:mannose-6-phosphate isomerase-like protein (cupin superfamily)
MEEKMIVLNNIMKKKMTVVEKPWGKEEILEVNDKYVVKRLTMFSGCKCSLQYHNEKKETIYVLSGLLKIYSGLSENKLTEKIYGPNDTITLLPGTIHRMEGVEDCVYLEASTPQMEDVVRIQDDYNRTKL